MTALHMGALHPVETILVFLIAFGPFVALALLVVVRRRRAQHKDDTARAYWAGSHNSSDRSSGRG